jgi:hypothetical protein
MRARTGLTADNTIAMNTAPSNASHTTHRGDKGEDQGHELNGEYDHEVQRPIPQNDSPKARYPRGSRRQLSPGRDEEHQEGGEIYDVEREKFQSTSRSWMVRTHRKQVR